MSSVFDTGAAARLIMLLATPFNQQQAFHLGIIDRHGKKIKEPVSQRERRAYSKLHVVAFNLKKLIEKIPGGRSKIASYGAAAWLLKEEQFDTIEADFVALVEALEEEAAANAAGGGAVAGIGVGPDGEPGVVKKKKKKYKDANQLDNTNLLSRGAPK